MLFFEKKKEKEEGAGNSTYIAVLHLGHVCRAHSLKLGLGLPGALGLFLCGRVLGVGDLNVENAVIFEVAHLGDCGGSYRWAFWFWGSVWGDVLFKIQVFFFSHDHPFSLVVVEGPHTSDLYRLLAVLRIRVFLLPILVPTSLFYFIFLQILFLSW